jgi:hypothetical protein
MRARYQFALGLALAIEGDRPTVTQFNREYGEAAARPHTETCVEVDFAEDSLDSRGDAVRGGYKTMRWQTRLTAPDAPVLGARIEIAGRPRGFARTLVQGYFVEPLLSIAATRVDSVLLPAAAFRDATGTIVVLGRSGSGKTSLSMHALALGIRVVGDDQVVIDSTGACGPFPRRLRLYPDLRERVPVAYARLPRRIQVQLAVRRLIRLLSRGAVAPPLAVPMSIFGQDGQFDPGPITRVVILERALHPGELRKEPATVAEAVAYALGLLHEQREHLALAGGDAWRAALAETERREESRLEAAFRDISIERITVPSPLVGEAIGHVAEAAGLVGRPARP